MQSNQTKHVWRTILTEVLPYEVPLIFTNDIRYKYLNSAPPEDPQTSAAWTSLLEMPGQRRAGFTIPYNFNIRKGRTGDNTLSLLHPTSQADIAKFYDEFAHAILESTKNNKASLRRPDAVLKLYTVYDEIDDGADIDNNVHTAPRDEEIDTSKLVSYFSYSDYNLLSRFHESREYLSLEKQFPILFKADISRCFYNIYTHSVTWAVKNKKFSKLHANRRTFEQSFDRLMQSMNYNETNGIVVGPEFSRIFAEIILTDVDLNVVKTLERSELQQNENYVVKRYIDDYYIFCVNEEVGRKVIRVLSECLEEYKLFINPEKTKLFKRPFVTEVGMAKREIKSTFDQLRAEIANLGSSDSETQLAVLAQIIRSKTADCRSIAAKNHVGFHTISGWALGALRGMFHMLLGRCREAAGDEKALSQIEKSIVALFELTFYICHLDPRVPTTYALASILLLSKDKRLNEIRANSEWIDHLIEKELVDFVRYCERASIEKELSNDPVELYNGLILGAYISGSAFMQNEAVRSILDRLICEKPITYFKYVTLKFCMLADSSEFSDQLTKLNKNAIAVVLDNKQSLATRSDVYHMLCDLLSSPDLPKAEKQILWKIISSQTLSHAKIEQLAKVCGFVDWDSINLRMRLRRKRLRPIYD